MPLTASGKLKIVAAADLSGLGAREGTPVEYNWVLPGIAPVLLPWLAIIVLLAVNRNRRPQAWLIWLPIASIMIVTLAAAQLFSSDIGVLTDAIAALAVGLSAIWLLSDYLRRSHRLLTSLCVLPVLGGFSLLALLVKEGLNLLNRESMLILVITAVGVVAIGVALLLTGLVCHRYRPARIYLSFLVCLTTAWLLVAAPFFLIEMSSSPGNVAWSEFFVPVLLVVVVNFALLLPFLILSSASPFYRERLEALLNIIPEPLPPVMTQSPATDLPAGSSKEQMSK